jgi:hypothetical protein
MLTAPYRFRSWLTDVSSLSLRAIMCPQVTRLPCAWQYHVLGVVCPLKWHATNFAMLRAGGLVKRWDLMKECEVTGLSLQGQIDGVWSLKANYYLSLLFYFLNYYFYVKKGSMALGSTWLPIWLYNLSTSVPRIHLPHCDCSQESSDSKQCWCHHFEPPSLKWNKNHFLCNMHSLRNIFFAFCFLFFWFFFFCLFCLFFFETGFLCITLAVLEVTL